MTLDDVLRAPLPGRVDDVVERLQAIDVCRRGTPAHAEYRAIDPLLAETSAVRADEASASWTASSRSTGSSASPAASSSAALSEDVRIRQARAADSAAAAAVVRSVYDEYGFTWDEDGYHSDLRDVESAYAAFFVAERDGRIVGTAGLSEHGSLERLYVLPRRSRSRRRAPRSSPPLPTRHAAVAMPGSRSGRTSASRTRTGSISARVHGSSASASTTTPTRATNGGSCSSSRSRAARRA